MCAGAAEFEHHVIRNVDQGGDAALATAGQAVDHPRGRDGFGVDLAHHATRKRPHRSVSLILTASRGLRH
jgi:hypothetical protein